MIVETTKRDIQRSDAFQERAMGLAVGSEAFVFNVLRKDLYSDPIGSLIREYTVNAQDEHRKHGKADLPIFIQVPTAFQPELHIRDYAEGLTEEQVFEFFGNYGASDKRDSNDAVGFFGLGCKSAFAYTDSYIVKSFKDGMEYTFNIYIDETEIGKTAKISAEPTIEPNGIEIIIPVKMCDIYAFQNKVVSTVRYFKTKPVIKGMDYTPDLNAKTPIIKGEDWEFLGRGIPTIIMGEIPYPVDRYKMGENLETWESGLLNSEIRIYVSIGDVQVTASREALQMSEKTVKTIREKLVSIKDMMVTETEKAFAESKNLIEAKQLWHSVIGQGGGYADIIKSCDAGIKWKGEVLTDSYIKFDENHYVTRYYNRRTQIKSDASRNLQCKAGETIYFDDTDKATVGYKRRVRTLLNNGANDVTIIHTSDKKALEDFLGMSVKELASLNAVIPTKAISNRVGSGTDLSKRTKHTSKVFVLNVAKLKGSFSAASEVWEVKKVDNLKGVYIPIERFQPNGMSKVYNLKILSTIINDMEKAGMSINTPIYGIKKGMDTTGLGRFDKWVEGKVKANKTLHKDYSVAMAFSSCDLINVESLSEEKLSDDSIAKTYVVLYKALRKFSNIRDSKYNILKYFPSSVEPEKTIIELSNKFLLQYPMLEFVSYYDYNNSKVLEYIKERETNKY